MPMLRQRAGALDRSFAFGAGLILALSIAGALDAYTTWVQWRDAQAVARTSPSIAVLQSVTSDLAQARADVRDRLLSGSGADVDDYQARLAHARRKLETLAATFPTSDGQQALAAEVRTDLVTLQRSWTQVLDLYASRGRDAALQRMETVRAEPGLFASLDSLRLKQQAILARHEASLRLSYRVSFWAGIFSSVLGVVLVAWYVAALRRRAQAIADTAARLQNLTEALRTSDRRKDVFLATLAHELRSPLTPIQHASAILARGGAASRPDALKLAAMLDRQASQMTALVNDLLEIGRITQGKLELRRELVCLSRVLDTAIESSSLQKCPGRGIAWRSAARPTT